jgi:hypothetical protein
MICSASFALQVKELLFERYSPLPPRPKVFIPYLAEAPKATAQYTLYPPQQEKK